MNAPDPATIEARVRTALDGVADPCMASAGLDLSVADLGLVCDVRVEGRTVEVDLTFTELGCAFTHHLLDAVERAVDGVEGVEEVRITPVWLPRWSRDRLSSRARSELGAATRRLSRLAAPAPPPV